MMGKIRRGSAIGYRGFLIPIPDTRYPVIFSAPASRTRAVPKDTLTVVDNRTGKSYGRPTYVRSRPRTTTSG